MIAKKNASLNVCNTPGTYPASLLKKKVVQILCKKSRTKARILAILFSLLSEASALVEVRTYSLMSYVRDFGGLRVAVLFQGTLEVVKNCMSFSVTEVRWRLPTAREELALFTSAKVPSFDACAAQHRVAAGMCRA